MALSLWTPVAVSGTGNQVNTVAGNATFKGGIFGGFTLRNTTVAAIQVDIYDNTTNSGTLLATIDLTAKGSVGACQTVFLDHRGVQYKNGVYFAPSATGVQGSVYLA